MMSTCERPTSPLASCGLMFGTTALASANIACTVFIVASFRQSASNQLLLHHAGAPACTTRAPYVEGATSFGQRYLHAGALLALFEYRAVSLVVRQSVSRANH